MWGVCERADLEEAKRFSPEWLENKVGIVRMSCCGGCADYRELSLGCVNLEMCATLLGGGQETSCRPLEIPTFEFQGEILTR